MTEGVQDIRYAPRAFRSAPGLFGAIVVTLGVAIGGNATVFSWIEGVVLRHGSHRSRRHRLSRDGRSSDPRLTRESDDRAAMPIARKDVQC